MSSTEIVKTEMMADNSGLLKPATLSDAWRLAQYYASSGLLPDRYNKPEMVLTAMQFALELGLKPLTALRQIAVVKGTPSIFGDLPLSLCYASGKLLKISEKWLDKNLVEISIANKNLREPVFAATCEVLRKGDPEPLLTFFTMDDAIQAGLTSNLVWGKFPKRMLRYRARSQALKDKFPDCLNGIGIVEYDQNLVEEQMTNVTPQNIERDPIGVEDHVTTSADPVNNPITKQTLAERLKAKKDETPVIDVETT